MTLKELEGLFKLCRKYGVKSYSNEGIALTLNEELPTKDRATDNTDLKTEPTLSDEDVLLWSAGN